MSISVVIPGVLGRMGRILANYAMTQEGWELIGVTERHDHPDLTRDIGRILRGEPNGILIENDLRNVIVAAKVIIDFTAPDASIWHAEVAAEGKIPIVIGTTGLTAAHKERLAEYAKLTPIVYSPNMSVGVNLLWKTAQTLATVLGDEYDCEIIETHHRHKADAPSGTAVRLAEVIAEAWEKEADAITDHGRKGIVGEREYGRIGMHAVRGGDVVGEHTVRFLADGEEVFIGHRASNRENFVKGAYKAALFLQKAEPGLYNMWDVLKLN